MRLLGHHDLQARSGYHPVINEQNGRWIAYVGHHGGRAVNSLTGVVEPNGTSILDVTDPRNPKYLAHIPGEEGEGEAGGAQMVRACNGRDLPRATAARPTCCAPLALRGRRSGTSRHRNARCCSLP